MTERATHVLALETRAVATLALIAAYPCEHFTTGDCIKARRTPWAKYGADDACFPCIARHALSTEATRGES